MRHILKRVAGSLYVVFGVVLIWRGTWILLDHLDKWLFGHETLILAVVGVILGLILLYLHDHKIDELGHL